MPLVQIDLTDELTERIDALAATDLRARKHQVLALLMEAVEARTATEPAAPTRREPIIDRAR